MKNLKIKVCGTREPGNIAEVVSGDPDFIGFIFYPKSKRFIQDNNRQEILKTVPASTRKVGVFVNETQEEVLKIAENWKLEVIQLHGQESPDYCKIIQDSGYTVFKAFSVDDTFDFGKLKAYKNCCDYFLFDTKGKLPGGTGQKFNWEILEKYRMDIPFFLSGGISPDDLGSIRELTHTHLFGVDINSGFEISPGLKDTEKVKNFITEIRS